MSTTTALESIPDRLRPRQASTLLLWVILGFFVVFVIWSSLTKLDRTVRGQGKVIASSQLQTVSNLEGGVVLGILVHTGDMVVKDQPLVKLDPTATGAELGSGEATLMALRIKIARLKAEVLGQEPVYPYAGNAQAAELISIERALHAARMADLGGLSGAASARLLQAERGVTEADAGLDARRAAATQRAAELATTRELVDKKIEPRLSLDQAESAANVASSEASQAAATAARSRASITEAQATLVQARQDWRAKAADELTTAQGELAARESALPALEAKADRTVVRAPLTGRINRVLVTTVGSAVAPGAPIVEIAPSQDQLLIEARVRPIDIASVKIGQRARVNITAYDPSIYGGIEGHVESISPDAVAEERGQPGAGESYYIVRVRTVSNAITDGDGHKLPIGAGMIADVALLGDKRSVLAYILTPITRLSERAFRE